LVTQLSGLHEERERKVKEILMKHRGKENAIPASQIAHQIGLDEGETYSETRGLVLGAARKYQLPIAATTQNGYYFIETREELADYLLTLDGRIHEIETRKRLIMENYIRHHGEIEFEEGEI